MNWYESITAGFSCPVRYRPFHQWTCESNDDDDDDDGDSLVFYLPERIPDVNDMLTHTARAAHQSPRNDNNEGTVYIQSSVIKVIQQEDQSKTAWLWDDGVNNGTMS